MTVPVQNDKIVPQGLARLTAAYITQPNVRALLAAYLSPLQELENAFWGILEARVLATAPTYSNLASIPGTDNIVFDTIGALVGQARQGRGDVAYQTLIYLEIAVNRSTGRTTDWSRFAQILAPWASSIVFLNGDNAGFDFGAWDLTLPPVTVASSLSRAVPSGVGAVFEYTAWPDGNDFEWSDAGDGSQGQGASGQGTWGDTSGSTVGGLLVSGFAL